MGWLKLTTSAFAPAVKDFDRDLKAATQHVNSVSLDPDSDTSSSPTNPGQPEPSTHKTYKFVPSDVLVCDLPFIPASDVKARSRSSSGPEESAELWIVVDNVVYDCSDFVAIHPGGQQVIQSFRGEECSWQFWRFHGKRQMEEFGKPLRVGRTAGMVNRFAEPVRWVGMLGLSSGDEWEV